MCESTLSTDFGVSHRTGPVDAGNPDDLDGVGTEGWQATESRKWGQLENPPPHRYQGNFKLDEKVNVYSIGKIMHDLMTLSRWADVDGRLDSLLTPAPAPNQAPPQAAWQALNQAPNVWQQTYHRPVGPPGNQQPLRHFTEELTTNQREEYTPALRNLIYRCIRPCRSYRPSSARLVELIESGLKKYLHQLGEGRARRRRRTQDRHQVHLTVEEFNQIKRRGEANRQVDTQNDNDMDEWGNLLDKPCADFDEPLPNPPKDKWRQFYDEWPPEKDYKKADVQGQNWKAAGHKVTFSKGRRKKRVVSWDPNSQPEVAFRNKLDTMRGALQGLASNKPIGLLEYVLNHEKGDADAAVDVLRWMSGRLRNPGWSWLEDQTIQRRAEEVKKKCPRRTKSESLYFVANAGQGVEVVEMACRELVAIFG